MMIKVLFKEQCSYRAKVKEQCPLFCHQPQISKAVEQTENILTSSTIPKIYFCKDFNQSLEKFEVYCTSLQEMKRTNAGINGLRQCLQNLCTGNRLAACRHNNHSAHR